MTYLMHRFFLTDTPVAVDQPLDLSSLAQQLSRVLRLTIGERIVVLPGDGRAFEVEITELAKRSATGRVIAEIDASPLPTVRLTLYPCSLKADKFEWVLQKGTELGVARFVPVISERSVVRPAARAAQKVRALAGHPARSCRTVRSRHAANAG